MKARRTIEKEMQTLRKALSVLHDHPEWADYPRLSDQLYGASEALSWALGRVDSPFSSPFASRLFRKNAEEETP